MSQYSGKCDFWDHVGMIGQERALKAKVYIGKHRLYLEDVTDLLKYAPYLICVSYCHDGADRIVLSDESYIDRSEQEMLDFYLDKAIKKYKQCKRKKIPFVPEDYRSDWHDEVWDVVLKRVAEVGLKADTECLYTDMGDFYRREWLEDLVDSGMNEQDAYTWVYGWYRGNLMLHDKKGESEC